MKEDKLTHLHTALYRKIYGMFFSYDLILTNTRMFSFSFHHKQNDHKHVRVKTTANRSTTTKKMQRVFAILSFKNNMGKKFLPSPRKKKTSQTKKGL